MHRVCKKLNQSGEVALFIVIFSAMLMLVVTVSFTRIMIAGQQQTSNSDLSQSAYDSALAGVEDAKRALARYETICSGGGVDCSYAKTILASTDCNKAVKELIDVTETNNEVKVMSDNNSSALNQSYTCVKIALDTSDYVGVLSQGAHKVVPLRGTGQFDSLQIEWFSANDLEKTNTNKTISLANNSASNITSLDSSWAYNRPPIMRTQLIQFVTGSNANGLDNDSYTLFLYPKSTGLNSLDFTLDAKTTPIGAPEAIRCSSNLLSGGYACKAKIKLPNTIDSNRLALLYLTSIYNTSSYRLTLYNGSNPVLFSGIQPIIDSTGRTNDLFRRVQTRVEMTNVNFPYPTSAVYTKGDLCKAFKLTNKSSDYSELSCNP